MPDPFVQLKGQYVAVTTVTPDVEPSSDDVACHPSFCSHALLVRSLSWVSRILLRKACWGGTKRTW
jgi:hypothetical protein